MTVTIAALIFTICQPFNTPEDCEKYLNKCVKENLQTPYIKQFKTEVGRAKAVIGCAEKGGFLRER